MYNVSEVAVSKVDLHIHSKFSDDAELSIKEIMEKCMALNMELVSITDHNSVQGASESLEWNSGMRVLSGVELDCTYKGNNFHLLGYGFDHKRKEFYEIERYIFEQEVEAAEKKILLFQRATGIPASAAEIIAAAGGGVVTGEHVAEHVLARGDASERELLKPYLPGGDKSDMPFVRFYWDFFSHGKPAHVPIRYISLADANDLIHSANGISVLAHPAQNLTGGYGLLDSIIAEGIDGLEVFSSYHSKDEAAHFLDVARQNSLLVTSGSDFHGRNKPNIEIGCHGATLTDRELMVNLEIIGPKRVIQIR
jgi:predicted metal-dependent phosphoesterase TrpH